MQFPVADAHCDFLYGMVNRGYSIDSLTGEQTVYLPYLSKGGVALQFFAALIDSKLRVPYLQQCMDMVDAYYRMLDEHSDMFCPLSDHFNPSCGKIATVLTIEGGEAIEGCLSNLRLFHRLGVRAMSLTWNESNALAHPAMSRRNRGLTVLGRRVVEEMDRLGMAIDLAHLSDAGIDDILEMTDSAVFASHSNSREVYPHPRSLKDDHIKEIARRGGVVGINFYHEQLSGKYPSTSEDIVRHIDHVAGIGGIKSVCIGSDFDGMGRYPADLNNPSQIQVLLERLLRMGYTEADIRAIAYDNLYDYIIRFCR